MKKILISAISLLTSIGLNLLIKPNVGVYLKSETVLNALFILFTIIGWLVIYQVIRNTLQK